MKKLRKMHVAPAMLLVSAVVLGLMGPAVAHKATLEVTAQRADNGKISAVAYLEPPHGQTPIIFKYFKQKADGSWAFVAKQVESNQMTDGVYVVYFNQVKGDKRCKVKAIFKKANHDTVKDWSNQVNC